MSGNTKTSHSDRRQADDRRSIRAASGDINPWRLRAGLTAVSAALVVLMLSLSVGRGSDAASMPTTIVPLPAGSIPGRLAANPATGRVYVIDTSDNVLLVIQTPENSLVAEIPLGSSPVQDIATDSIHNQVYLTTVTGQLLAIDGASHVLTSTDLGNPGWLAVDEDSNKVYVASCDLTQVDGNTLQTDWDFSLGGPCGLDVAIDAAGNRVFVLASGQVLEVDSASAQVTGTQSVPGVGFQAITFNDATGKIIVATVGSAPTPGGLPSTGGSPFRVDDVTRASEARPTPHAAGTVTGLSAVVENLPGDDILANPITNRIYVLNRWGSVTVVDASTMATLSVTSLAGKYLTVDPTAGRAYVSLNTPALAVLDEYLNQDDDGTPDFFDVCPSVYDPSQNDADSDKVGDACDNCPANPNTEQEDMDQDGLGDACDSDWDGDGVSNTLDNCPGTGNGSQIDTDSDQLGDACDSRPCAPDVVGKGRVAAPEGEADLVEHQAADVSVTPLVCPHVGSAITPAPTALSQGGAGAGARGPVALPNSGGVPNDRAGLPWLVTAASISLLGLSVTGFLLARRQD